MAVSKTEAVGKKHVIVDTTTFNQGGTKDVDVSRVINRSPYQSETAKNFNKDLATGKLEFKKWYQFTWSPFSFGRDRYVYHPDPGETYGNLKNRYGFSDGYLRQKGNPAFQLSGDANQRKIDFNIVLKKDDLNKMFGIKPQIAKN